MNTMTTSTHISRFLATAALCAFGAAQATISTAGDADGVRSITVKFADLNLSNPQGAAALYSRIASAAREACEYSRYQEFAEARAQATICVHHAIAEAVTKVNQPALIAVYNAKNRQPLPLPVALASN